jgi:hypothetical protein
MPSHNAENAIMITQLATGNDLWWAARPTMQIKEWNKTGKERIIFQLN